MGTKLEYAINPLATTTNNSSLAIQLGDWGYSQEAAPKEQSEHTTLLRITRSTMDGQMFDLQNVESIKKTMLMQEDVFRQQVRELHRLYERQMKLMHELKKEAAMTRKCNSIWNQPFQEINPKYHGFFLGDDPGETGSGSCSAEISWSRPKALYLESLTEEPASTSIPPDTEWDQKSHYNSSQNVKSCNMSNSDGPDEEVDVELSLSLCSSSSKKTLKTNVQRSSLDLGSSDTNSNGGGPCSSVLSKRDSREQSLGDSGLALINSSSKFNQNVAKSNWFAQDLSLKRT